MAILSVEWNGFHPRVFLTCGADWSVKIWDHTKTEPIFTLDFKIPVCDAKWAPFSATIFAVATADGKVLSLLNT
jgi:dynein intermediate chain 1, axonemal